MGLEFMSASIGVFCTNCTMMIARPGGMKRELMKPAPSTPARTRVLRINAACSRSVSAAVSTTAKSVSCRNVRTARVTSCSSSSVSARWWSLG
eukprot:2486003-Prymnesium_polylepis.3